MKKATIYFAFLCIQFLLSGCRQSDVPSITTEAPEVNKQTNETGIVPFSPEAIESIVKADLIYQNNRSNEITYYERIYSQDTLASMEKLLRDVEHNSSSACPFYEFSLNILKSDDSDMTLAMASDSCNVYYVNGMYFNYDVKRNGSEFYSLFPHAPINNPQFRTTENALPAADSGLTYFKQEEINKAIECVEEKFRDFKGCEMIHLWYDKEQSDFFVKDYIKYGNEDGHTANAENVIVLLSDFFADSEKGAETSLLLGSPYYDFNWILKRDNETAPWTVVTWGY